MICTDCGHAMAGAGPVGICIGCPCDKWHGFPRCACGHSHFVGDDDGGDGGCRVCDCVAFKDPTPATTPAPKGT